MFSHEPKLDVIPAEVAKSYSSSFETTRTTSGRVPQDEVGVVDDKAAWFPSIEMPFVE